MRPQLRNKLLNAFTLRLRAFWIGDKKVSDYGAVGDHKQYRPWYGGQGHSYSELLVFLDILPWMEHADMVAYLPPQGPCSALLEAMPSTGGSPIVNGNAQLGFWFYVPVCNHVSSNNAPVTGSPRFRGWLKVAYEVIPNLRDPYLAQQIAVWEAGVDRGAWQEYHDWCLEIGWDERARELSLEVPNFIQGLPL